MTAQPPNAIVGRPSPRLSRKDVIIESAAMLIAERET